jgi:hypothetical protein
MPVEMQDREGDQSLHQAQEHLRIIRELMERSTRHSTFSGLSGVLAGTFAILGCVVQHWVVPLFARSVQPGVFLVNWSVVIALAVGTDFILTKQRARLVGKTILSRLGRQMLMAAAPALAAGTLLTLFLLQRGMMHEVYPVWVLCYGLSVSAVGLFSQPEVGHLGRAFLLAGGLAMTVRLLLPVSYSVGEWGLLLIAVTFGGFHILYGIRMSRIDGW